ncbi:MAG TPA: ABC-type transport auxiliary lipoprotein family protein [Candidatus Acidoferrales bacterium]|nr:ABC-type transport auxiliary lipoprotein family protein [Candidatus Acidoferrales bacterium]
MIRQMHARMREILLILIVAGLSASCGSSRPIKYYELDVPDAPVENATSALPVSLLVARVTADHLYRDERLVYRASELQLGTYEYQRWSEPPADMIQESLISALRATKQYRSVAAIASNLHGDYIVRAHLDALDEVDKPQLAARFSLHLELYDPKSASIVWSDSYTHDERVSGKNVVDVVKALNDNVRAGTQTLVENLGRYFASHPLQGER